MRPWPWHLGQGSAMIDALAAALAARGGDGKEALLSAHLAGAAAIGAGVSALGAAARAGSAAGFAGRQALELYDFFGTARRFFELDLEVVAQIVAAP